MRSASGSRSVHYRLNAIKQDGRREVLIQSFQHSDPDVGKFIERVIEYSLLIRNRPVTGEMT